MFKLIISLSFLCVAFAAQHDCNKLLPDAENCLKTTIFLGERKVPHDIKALAEYKSYFPKAIKCLKDGLKCGKGLATQLFSFVLSGVKKLGRKYFSKNSNDAMTLIALDCFQEEYVKYLGNCVLTTTAQIQAISKRKVRGEPISSLCCAVRQVEQCVLSSVEQMCDENKDEAKKILEEILNAVIGDGSDLLCTQQSTLQICEKDYSQLMKQLKQFNYTQVENGEFFIRPLLKLVETLTE